MTYPDEKHFAGNKFRTPDWRWHAAEVLQTGSPPYPDWADEWVYYAADLKRRFSKAKITQFGAAGEAFRLWRSMRTSLGSDRVKSGALAAAEIEGCFLAGKSHEEIASNVGLSADVLQWYGKLFFDIDGRLAQSVWIACEIIGQLHGGSVEALIPAIAKAYGYYTKDVELVRYYLRGLDSEGLKLSIKDGPMNAVLQDTRAALTIKANLAVRTVIPEGRSFRSIMEMHNQVLEQARAAGEKDGAQSKYAAALDSLKNSLNWSYGAEQPALEDRPALAITNNNERENNDSRDDRVGVG